MRKLKHLPLDQWPPADIEAFASAFAPGDIFDETAGPGAHLAEGTRRMIRTAYRRWLGFLKEYYPRILFGWLRRTASRPSACGPSSTISVPR